MSVNQRKILTVLVSTIIFVKHLVGFEIIKCGSNKIVDTTKNKHTGKYTINFDESVKVRLNDQDDVSIWCESNHKYDVCELQGANFTCSRSYPLRCNDDFVCKNKIQIKYEPSSSQPNKCTFKFTNPIFDGKKICRFESLHT